MRFCRLSQMRWRCIMTTAITPHSRPSEGAPSHRSRRLTGTQYAGVVYRPRVRPRPACSVESRSRGIAVRCAARLTSILCSVHSAGTSIQSEGSKFRITGPRVLVGSAGLDAWAKCKCKCNSTAGAVWIAPGAGTRELRVQGKVTAAMARFGHARRGPWLAGPKY